MRDSLPRHPSAPPIPVAIVGGGAAGVLVAAHLLRASAGRLQPRLIEPRALPGEGIAYSTRQAAHLLNVRAGNMSAFADLPGDFVDYAAAACVEAEPAEIPLAQRYLPRALFAGYLQATLGRLDPDGGVHLRDTVLDITGEGPFQLRLASGAVLDADAVVLATGNAPRPPLAALDRVVHAWDYDAVAAIGADEEVAVVGSGLSMVDAAVSLAAQGHRGRIDVFSRHGLLPLSHHAQGGPHGAGALPPLGLRARVRALREDAAQLAREGKPWQWVMDRVRPEGRALWQGLSRAEQARFLRHAVRFWDIHRHRIAPEVAARLQGLLASGQLRLHAARVRGLDAAPPGIALRYRARGGGVDETVVVDRVIDATGIESRPAALPGSLLATLVARGTVAPGPHGLGIDVDGEGTVRRPDGRPLAGLIAIGTPRLGVEWETTAIPDLRVQAAAIARRLLHGAG